MSTHIRAHVQPVGLIGLGLMGRGIATCLLSQGFEVMAYNRTAARARESTAHIDEALRELVRRGVIPRARMAGWYRAGLLKSRFDIANGIENMPSAFLRLLTSRNTGKQLVQVAAEPG